MKLSYLIAVHYLYVSVATSKSNFPTALFYLGEKRFFSISMEGHQCNLFEGVLCLNLYW